MEENPYESTANAAKPIPKPKKTGLQWVGAVFMWVVTSFVLLTCGWPIAIIYAILWTNNRANLAEKELIEENIHECPQCHREVAKTSKVCPRCEYRFN